MLHSAIHFEYPFTVRQLRRPCGTTLFPACTLVLADLVVETDGTMLVNELARATGAKFEQRVDEWLDVQEYGFSLPNGYVVISRVP